MRNSGFQLRVHPTWSLVLASALALALSAGCATRLVPDYDRELATGLRAISASILGLFAGGTGGLSKGTYAKREHTYSQLIGGLQSLRLQSESRPAPDRRISEVLSVPDPDPDCDSDIPTTCSLDYMIGVLEQMRLADRKQGVSTTEVAAFRGSMEGYMHNALTYENALQR